MNAQPRLIFQLVIAAMFIATSVAAVAGEKFPGGQPDRRILEVQQKVDELFERGDYERAYFIYREELAPLGDKFAQYMVGYMNIVGKGVPRDYTAGSAWYRLAAERGDESYSRARDEVWDQFNDEQRLRSDEFYAELRLDFSDAMIIVSFIEKDLDLIRGRSQSSTLNNELVDSKNQFVEEREQIVEEARQRIQIRLGFLDGTVAGGTPLTAAETARIREVKKRAQAETR